MVRHSTRTLRYARSWLSGEAHVASRDVEVDRGDRRVPATLMLPAGRTAALPAWIVLHGVTRPGRAHPQLVRFARAVAHAGSAVLVPEIPEWSKLDLTASKTLPTLLGCLNALEHLPEVAPSAPGLIGFSFGAPLAVSVSGREPLRGRLAGVAGFGAYCDLERTVRFQLTGQHEWRGRRWRVEPDPYGRWIVAANYLARVPGHGDAEDVARALHHLAAEAGERGLPAWEAAYDASKERWRRSIGAARRDLFDLFAPAAHAPLDPLAAEPLVRALAATVREVEPALEPTPALGQVRARVELIHGRGDRLIPFSESLRLRERLPDRVAGKVTVTRLFAHAKGDVVPSMAHRLWEGLVFVRALRRVLATV